MKKPAIVLPKLDLPFNPKILVAVAAVILFVLGLLLVAQGFVDTRDYQAQIRQIIKERTGKDVIIKGKVYVSLVPVPTIFIPGVELRDEANGAPTPAVTVEMMRVTASIFSVIEGKPEISSVILEKPVLEIQRAKDNTIHWDWLNMSLVRALSQDKSQAPININIVGGHILYNNESEGKSIDIQDVYGDIMTGQTPSVRGGFTLYGHELRLTGNTQAVKDSKFSVSSGALPFNFRLFSDEKNAVQMEGSLDVNGDAPKLAGNVMLDVEDLRTWLKPKQAEKKELLGQITNQSVKAQLDVTKLPVKLEGALQGEGLEMTISHANFQGLNSAGQGTIALEWQDIPAFTVTMQFSALDYNQWKLLALQAMENKRAAEAVRIYKDTDEEQENPFPRDLQLTFNLNADRLYVGTQSWEKAELSARLADEMLTVDKFNILLPGKSSLSLFGIISQGSTNELRFEGSMETQGESLRKMLTVWDESAADLPETGFRGFYARSNIFVSPQQVRMSEADVKIDELRFNGGMVAYLDANPRLEADVKLRNINFDYFRDVWRNSQKLAGKLDSYFKLDKNINFNWLKKLQTSIDFKVSVDGFTFLDRKGDNASFRLYAKEGEFGVYNIRLYYPNETMEGNFGIDVKGAQPLFNISINTGELNVDYFKVETTTVPELQTPEIAPESTSESTSESMPESANQSEGGAAPAADASNANAAVPAAPLFPQPVPPAAPVALPAVSPNTPAPAALSIPVTPPAVSANAARAPLHPGMTPKPPVDTDKKSEQSVSVKAPAVRSQSLPSDTQGDEKTLELIPQAAVITEETSATASASGSEPGSSESGGNADTPPAESTAAPVAPVAPVATTPAAIAPTVKPAAALAIPAVAKDDPKKRWSETLIDMSWMDGITGAFDVTIGRLVMGDRILENVKFKGKLQDSMLAFQGLTFTYWQGKFDVTGSIYGGRVPGVSIGFTIYSAELHDMIKTLTDRDNLSGRVSISGTIATSGVNMLSWVSQAEMKLVMAGRGVTARGVNLQGVTDAVGVSRTASDVFNNVNRALVNGSSTFSVDGNLNAKGGIMRTPGITLKSGAVTGNLTGEVRLVPWTMSLSTLFQFPALTSETIPTMTVQISGPLSGGEVRTDTASLEAYVAKKIVGH